LNNIYHVATNGSDETGDGSEANPFATIQKGVDVANDMDTVYVFNGVYEGGIVISNKAISLIGESIEQTKIIEPISSPQISIVDCQAGITRVENFIIKRGSSYYGGGIYTSGSIVEINSVDFSYNSSSSHGAAINSIESTVKVQNSTFSHNESNYLGGAIYVDPLTTCEIYNSSFDNNEALWGGAIATVGGGKLLVEGCNISFNTALGNNPNPNEDYPTFGGGGGIYHEWSDSLEIYDSEITNNTAATGAGGGIAVYLSNDVTIDNIVLSDNSSSGPNYPSGGGGVAFYRADNVLFENSTIANNVSNHNSGGGIFLGSESGQASIVVHATFNRLTIVNNSALSGGAIFCWSAILNLYHSTLAQNEASNIEWSGGGLASHYVTEPNIISSLFYDNTPNSIHNGYPYTPVLVAYSLVQEQWVGAGNLINVDPLFCDPDSGDYSLAENSPCVGAGEGGSNMGAYEIGCDPIILSTSSELLPVTYTLHQNYPNPFNPVTRLRYDLAENSLVNITIYDMVGRQVKTLINQTQDAGYRSIVWDATNDYGKPVSAGIYLYQIQAGKYISTKKMVLLK
ncbi:T9SS type A sorting domain-containing protein, partial [bacterium]